MATPLVSSRFKDVTVAGRNLSVNLLNNVESMSVELSSSAISAFKVTFADTHEFNIYRSTVVNPGQTLTYEGFTFDIGELETGSGNGGPTVSLNCVSKRVTALSKQTGEKSWGTHADVSAWVKAAATSVNFTAVVQPGLGTAEIARAKPEGDKVESTWDVMTKLKDEVGVWLFEYGNLLVFAKPTWWAKVAKGRWTYTWSTMTEHSPDLLAAPQYTRTPSAERDQREKLQLSVTGDLASKARPGDIVTLNSRLPNVGFKGQWIINSVDVGSTVRDPVALSCVRIVDPAIRTKASKGLTIPTSAMTNNPAGSVAGYSGQQLTNARYIVNAGIDMKVSLRAQRIAVMTAMGESSLINVNHGDTAGPDSCGLFQQRDPWGPRTERMNATSSAKLFYKALLQVPGWEALEPTIAAHRTQINADPNHYAKFWTPAVQVVDAIYVANRGKEGVLGANSPTVSSNNPAVRSSAQAWINANKGKALDFDGAYGAQCVDVFKYYNRDVVGGPAVLGNGRDYYPNNNLMGKYVRVPPSVTPILGDVACWDGVYGVIDGVNYGHIAIVIRDLGNGFIECFTQNPGPCHVGNLTKAGLQGYLRPKSVKPPPLNGKPPAQGAWEYW
jgi:hypothetical protein